MTTRQHANPGSVWKLLSVVLCFKELGKTNGKLTKLGQYFVFQSQSFKNNSKPLTKVLNLQVIV